MKRLRTFLLPALLVHRKSLPRNLLGFPNNLPLPIYTPGRTTQCPRAGLEPGPLDPWMSALTVKRRGDIIVSALVPGASGPGSIIHDQ